ncbi:MAG: HAD-IIIC family phosphatase [Gemmatimonadales bacterium]
MASVLVRAPRRKGIVTDLDDTLWKGLVGEVGPGNVAWTLSDHAQLHGLYQQLLESLAATGVLIAVASKNDPAPATEALGRSDMHLKTQNIFPTEIGWGPKSASIARILAAWNIGPEALVFVDDSPMELAEVKAAHPAVECIRFPKNDPAGLLAMLVQLRRLFGKSVVLADDSIRMASLRNQADREAELDAAGDPESFLRTVDARMRVSYSKAGRNPRLLELVNKTNQFNANGRRVGEAEWDALRLDDRSFVAAVSYDEKFGPLGTIAVIAGLRADDRLIIKHWVMSCRAFSRRIEHRCLTLLAERFGVHTISVDYHETPRNGPFRTFIETYLPTRAPLTSGEVEIRGPDISGHTPPTYQTVTEDDEP